MFLSAFLYVYVIRVSLVAVCQHSMHLLEDGYKHMVDGNISWCITPLLVVHQQFAVSEAQWIQFRLLVYGQLALFSLHPPLCIPTIKHKS